ncbi:hypothetical protein [Comamonas testosteroni]|uniref:hypothetical protein n=1 Tax=Comamonas testosteroni TaxID=285 RepID=UPI000ABBADC3|nr:hypothetical protein [Comamonas testosteroni]
MWLSPQMQFLQESGCSARSGHPRLRNALAESAWRCCADAHAIALIGFACKDAGIMYKLRITYQSESSS